MAKFQISTPMKDVFGVMGAACASIVILAGSSNPAQAERKCTYSAGGRCYVWSACVVCGVKQALHDKGFALRAAPAGNRPTVAVVTSGKVRR